MTKLTWAVVDNLARLLDPGESEAVLGDLVESRYSAWRAATEMLGLVIRRQLEMWWDWRPWVAGPGLAFPTSFLLMGVSLSVTVSIQRLVYANVIGYQTPRIQGLMPIGGQLAMLVIWSWTGGFVVGSLSRRTIWASALFYIAPCMFCLSRFRTPGLSRFDLLLFLVPAIAGICRGLGSSRIGLRPAIAIALTVTVLMIVWWAGRGLYRLDWVLILPAWYIAASSSRRLRTVS